MESRLKLGEKAAAVQATRVEPAVAVAVAVAIIVVVVAALVDSSSAAVILDGAWGCASVCWLGR